jgi:hypothetical protein
MEDGGVRNPDLAQRIALRTARFKLPSVEEKKVVDRINDAGLSKELAADGRPGSHAIQTPRSNPIRLVK